MKNNISKIVFIASFFFIFSVFVASAQNISLKELGKLFAFSQNATVGNVDTSIENIVKICKDVTCTKPEPGIIDFGTYEETPLIIDKEKGISGKIWGGELGWINFNYPEGGVFFADSSKGLLKGIAKGENGIVNFSVTGQKVIIDPITGEWDGWAWASGPDGGWVKFNCKENSCVRTIWQEKTKENPILATVETSVKNIPSSTVSTTTNEIINQNPNNFYSNSIKFLMTAKDFIYQKCLMLGEGFVLLGSSAIDLFSTTAKLAVEGFSLAGNFIYTYSKNLSSLVLNSQPF